MFVFYKIFRYLNINVLYTTLFLPTILFISLLTLYLLIPSRRIPATNTNIYIFQNVNITRYYAFHFHDYFIFQY